MNSCGEASDFAPCSTDTHSEASESAPCSTDTHPSPRLRRRFVPESRGAVKSLERKRRTPLMIAALHGSLEVLSYLLQAGADAHTRSEDDERCTAMHCAASGGSALSTEAIKMLLLFGADRGAVDAYGRQPVDVLPALNNTAPAAPVPVPGRLPSGASPPDGSPPDGTTAGMCGPCGAGDGRAVGGGPGQGPGQQNQQQMEPDEETRLSDEFRMYEFKVRRCCRTRAHDWTECPFTHPGEKARRRDPRRFSYCGRGLHSSTFQLNLSRF